ncbi:RNA polymerase sigma factor [Henriciella aquimarina]|uniref:RNA polymerase sigma factor n=1 Tax=Henriciella aquimarina TaxID=545261 RepID=UPI0013019D62|nr:sigma-70 family RNA polymerase sigma factor [Henriciella aquimarina]
MSGKSSSPLSQVEHLFARSNTAATFDKLYRDYWGELCARLYRTFGKGPPDPEDAAQAAFVRFAALDDPNRVRDPRAFLLTTARNFILDQKRSQNRSSSRFTIGSQSPAEIEIDDLTPERVILGREQLEIVEQVVATLTQKQKIVLNLSRIKGYTYTEICNETGWSYGDVYRQTSIALAKLAEALDRGDRQR